jgi:hypothetical protein
LIDGEWTDNMYIDDISFIWQYDNCGQLLTRRSFLLGKELKIRNEWNKKNEFYLFSDEEIIRLGNELFLLSYGLLTLDKTCSQFFVDDWWVWKWFFNDKGINSWIEFEDICCSDWVNLSEKCFKRLYIVEGFKNE